MRRTSVFNRLQVFATERLRGAEVHRYAVLHDTVLIEYLIQHLQWTTAVHHVVFGDDLEPVDDRLLFEDVLDSAESSGRFQHHIP